MGIVWRPLALVASLAAAAVAVVMLWAYLVAAHDLSRVVQLFLLFVAFAVFWYAAWSYMGRAGSVAAVRARSWVVTKAVAGGAIVLTALVVWGWIVGLSDDDSNSVLTCSDCTSITVTRVIDGDTLVSGNERVRLYGINAPEVGERCADGATRRLRELAGDDVRIEMGPRDRDVYDRLLAYLYTSGGESIDGLLVAEGHAVAWTRDGQHRDYLVGLERTARSGSEGCLWRG